jgi:hypothetical protein
MEALHGHIFPSLVPFVFGASVYSAHLYIPFIAALFPGSVVTIVIFGSKNTSLPNIIESPEDIIVSPEVY